MDHMQSDATAGTLDKTFGLNGVSMLPNAGSDPNYPPYPTFSAVLPGNKALIAEASSNQDVHEAKLIRLDAAGVIDTSFGVAGIAKVVIPERENFYVTNITRPDSGEYLIIGMVKLDTAVVRMKENGDLDTTYGADHNGIVTIRSLLARAGVDVSAAVGCSEHHNDMETLRQFKGANGSGGAAAVHRDGKTVVALDVTVVRLDAYGSLDKSFNQTGFVWVEIPNGRNLYVHGVTVQPDGKVLVSGEFATETGYRIYVMRYDQSGAVDKTFNGSGYVFIPVVENFSTVRISTTLKPDGGIVVSGYFDESAFLAVLDSSGRFDTRFNNGQLLLSPFRRWSSCAVQADGKIIVSGGTIVARYSPEGVPDASFGPEGKGWVTHPLEGHFFRMGAGLTLDDRLVVTSYGFGEERGAVLRYLL